MSKFGMVAAGSSRRQCAASATVCGRPPEAISRLILLSALAVAFAVLAGCRSAKPGSADDGEIQPDHLGMFSPLQAAAPVSGVAAQKVDLGRRLYYDTHLSKNNSISCNSCHDLVNYGVDRGRAVSLGHDKKPGGRNSPTVYNAVLQFAQFWDGRAPNLAAQASGPMMNPVEMGMPDPAAVLAILHANREYVRMFKKAYPDAKDPVTIENTTDAIARFESGLLTPAPWDDYLRGSLQALTPEQKAGLHIFLNTGCATCHSGIGLGGNSYQKLGALRDWPDQQSDRGRLAVTNQPGDAMYFKVPMLRNIEMTGPYFHNGQVATLDEAVRLMSEYQTGHKLSPAEITSVLAFLHALTGPIPTQYVQPAAEKAAASPWRNGRRTNTERGE